MKDKLLALRDEALSRLEQLDLEVWRVEYLGKKGELALVLRGMAALSAEERPVIGLVANEVRANLEEAFAARKAELDSRQAALREKAETIDVTLPGRAPYLGAEHPLRKVIRRIEDIFIGFGFTVEDGPEVELDRYNFEALNLPKDHPARDMQDTFYLTEEILLRTHTSPVQARTLERRCPEVPIRIVVPGRVYRRDDDDATHSHAFMQIEALVVDHGIRMSDLKGILLQFARELFGADQEIRLRPSFFPFTEPSAEMDIRCIYCHGAGCSTCKQTGWIEILGCGMVHPHVLKAAGYDTGSLTGFAIGMGVERIAMLSYQVEDIRQFYLNDVRLLEQFATLAR
ncbi:MAG: phenylalanine--tRNA ligase subunit alpha [Bacilli bacterium]